MNEDYSARQKNIVRLRNDNGIQNCERKEFKYVGYKYRNRPSLEHKNEDFSTVRRPLSSELSSPMQWIIRPKRSLIRPIRRFSLFLRHMCFKTFAKHSSAFLGHHESCTALEDFEATESGQLSVTKGQRLHILEFYVDAPEWAMVSTIAENCDQTCRQGVVPFSILSNDTGSIFTGANDGSTASCSKNTDRPAIDSTSSSAPQNAVKRKSLRRFFNSQSGSANPQRPQSVTLVVRASTSSTGPQYSLSATEPLQPPSPSFTDPTNERCLSSKESDSVIVSGTQSVLSSFVEAATTATTACVTASTCPLSVTPAIADSIASDTTNLANSGDQIADFDLPPPMSDLSSTIADAVASHNIVGEIEQQQAVSSLVETTSEAGAEMEISEKETKSAGETARMKRQYVLMELVETERDYVKDLSSVVDGYMANLQTMELPEDLVGKDKIIFANIAQILDFHKTLFLKEIEKCLEDYEVAGSAFFKYERRLHTYYVKYCQNKPKSDFLMAQDDFEQFFAETKQKLGHKVALCDLLIKPVQRIMKYQLLLKDIMKYTERAGDRVETLQKALQVMHVVPKACDDMMQVGRLQNFDGNLSAQGKLIFQGTLAISDNVPSQPFKGKDRRIFLFEQSAIIADCILPKKEFGNPTYIFRNQIMINKMVLEAHVSDEPLRFIVRSSDPIQPNSFLAQANTLEEKEEWILKINSQLDQQKTLLAALVDPKRYQNQLAGGVGAISLDDDSSDKRKPMFSRLAGKSKDNQSTSPSTTIPQQTNPTQSASAHSPKHNSSNKSSKLFGFGKKSNNKAAVSPPPEDENLTAQLICPFNVVRDNQIEGEQGEKVEILEILNGNAKVKKEDGKIGYIPNYFLEIDDIPGENFSEQIRYRRKWYQYVDKEESSLIDESNPEVLLQNLPEIGLLASFVPYLPSKCSLDSRKPVCISHLEDLFVHEGDIFVLKCQFSCLDEFTVTWRGAAITKAIQRTKLDSEDGSFTLTVKNATCNDSGQYWVKAENEYGVDNSVAWISVLSIPGIPSLLNAEIIDGDIIRLNWSAPSRGNSRYLWYSVEFKNQDSDEFRTLIESLNTSNVLIENLTENSYVFRVFAYNQLLRGNACEPITVTITEEIRQQGHQEKFFRNFDEPISYASKSFFEEYSLGGLVNKGQFTNVHVATRYISGQRFAAKCFSLKSYQEISIKKQMEWEILALLNLNHQNIIKLEDVFKEDDQIILLTEWIDGRSLIDYFIYLGYISEKIVRNLCIDLLKALCYMHHYGLLHLNINPDNILIQTQGSPRLVLIDFGACSRVGTANTMQIINSLDFTAPEQFTNQKVTPKIDIWCVGVILHILQYGFSPFELNNDEELKIIFEENENMNNRLIKFSSSFISFINLLLTVDYRKRPSAVECLTDEWMINIVSEEFVLVDYLEDFLARHRDRNKYYSLQKYIA